MIEPIALAQVIFAVYTPFIIAFVGFSVPMIAILLSVFARGRDAVSRSHGEELAKITEDIRANEVSKKHSAASLVGKLIYTRLKLLLLNPAYYLLFLLIPPVASLLLSITALYLWPMFFITLSVVFLLGFLFIVWNLIILIADITVKRDEEKEERERITVELLQDILKNTNPNASLVQECSLKINDQKLKDGIYLLPAVLGKDSSWKISFINSEKAKLAKRVEVGIQFPADLFEIKKQNGYSVYDPENIVRFKEEFVASNTNYIFSPSLVFLPKRTGEYEIRAWIKGENIETVSLSMKIKVEMEA